MYPHPARRELHSATPTALHPDAVFAPKPAFPWRWRAPGERGRLHGRVGVLARRSVFAAVVGDLAPISLADARFPGRPFPANCSGHRGGGIDLSFVRVAGRSGQTQPSLKAGLCLLAGGLEARVQR
jgi:hypothetical protein